MMGIDMGHGSGNVWVQHPELLEKLKELAAEGLTNSAIARALGHGLTRNAIIGKITRMGIPHRSNGMSRTPKAFNIPPVNGLGGKQQRRTAPLKLAPPPDAPDPMVDEHGEPITMVNVTDHHCRYVHGDVGTSSFRFCGHRKDKKAAFCEYHAGRCYDAAHPARSNIA
jgi:GcrA cell cycle regulator